MLKSIDDLSIDELWEIAKCKRIANLNRHFNKATCDNLLVESRRRDLGFLKNSHSFNDIILTLTLHEPSLPIIMLWNIVGSVTLFLTSLAIITIFTGALLLFGLIVYGVITPYELKDKNQEDRDFFDLDDLQTKCHQKLLTHYSILLDNPNLATLSDDTEPLDFVGQPIKTSIKNSVGCGLLVTVSAFCTYYIGTSAVLLAFGLAASFATLTGPIGILVAIGVSIALGVYFGIQEYRHLRYLNNFEYKKAGVTQRNEKNQQKCNRLKKLVDDRNENAKELVTKSTPSLRKESVTKMFEDKKSLNKQLSFNNLTPKQRDYGTFSRL